MPPIDEQPTTWAAMNKQLRKRGAEGKTSDTDLFGDDPLSPKKADNYDYLGHFGNDSVAEMGHNDGAKKLGIRRVGEGKIAAQGFKKIPGNANDGYVAKKVRESLATATASSYRYGGPIPSYGHGPIMGERDAAPLRNRSREAKRTAGPGKGPLRSKGR